MQGGGVLIYIRSGIFFKVLAKSQLAHVNETEFIVKCICNHDYIIIDYKLEPFIFNKRSVCTRDFRKFDSDLFTCQLKLQIDSSSFSAYTSKDPNFMLEQFQMIALRLLDEQAPFINRTLKKTPAPWFNTSLRLRCKERDKLYNKAKRMASAPLIYKYKLMRKQLKCDIRQVVIHSF